jgi:hypothetical protein
MGFKAMNRERTSIKDQILELCAEDDYGSWELWWAIGAENRISKEGELQHDFLTAVEELVKDHVIIAKAKTADHKIAPVSFSMKRLQEEIRNAAKPNPDQYYWFGLPED